ncbi:class I adenylate-forming enzyme family protein [Albimonas pacifica]|uniref:Acyl-CoA synthetase n=1 Tax=Albimonas pacifica TaxID=1114924 RepID=A0A1I3M0I4_9RHOB|nr:class I adenylate-forming enzyme family protein [Albimonas pacifica]SFI90483.1 acyl-CoA synthetase [Albimonas pacifica]
MGERTAPLSQNLLTRLSFSDLQKFRAEGFWAEDTLHDLARAQAEARPDAVAIRDGGCVLTWAELAALAETVAADLRAAGLRPGDRVAAWLSPRVETAAVLLACSREGWVCCPSLHRNHTVAEIEELLVRMNAAALVAETGYGADAGRADVFARAGALPSMRRVIALAPPAPRSAAQIAGAFRPTDAPAPPPAGAADHVVYLAFTSGTTGKPKGVMHSNNTLLANARALAGDWGFDAASVIYTLSPLSHNLGFGAMVLGILTGAELAIHDLPKGASLLARLRELGATFVFGVPAHAMDLLAEIEAAGDAALPSLHGFRISGAAAPRPLVEGLLSYGVRPQSGYGMTEACSHHYTLPGDPPAAIAGTSGRACPGYEIAIFDVEDPDRLAPQGEIGQIGGRGASLMLGYFDDQSATERSFNREGWFLTGDLGRLDPEGRLQITGRIKDIIIRGGHNIHPARIEALADRFPGVERAAALPVKDERLGEKVCLVVMPRNGAEIDPDGLLAHLDAQGLSRYDMPEFFLQVPEIPLGPSGKMLKRALLPEIAAGRLAPQPIRFRG